MLRNGVRHVVVHDMPSSGHKTAECCRNSAI